MFYNMSRLYRMIYKKSSMHVRNGTQALVFSISLKIHEESRDDLMISVSSSVNACNF